MSSNVLQQQSSNKSGFKPVILGLVFIIVAIVGLTYVKWYPYYHKAVLAAGSHSIGSSIITGKNGVTPQPSWQAAWDYTAVYFKSIWKAMVLGLFLGSLVQVLLPKYWIKKTFGGTGFGSTLAAGAAALPGMMCSCCAAPVAVGLRKSKASVNSSLAFLLGNPVLNPATIIFMGFVLSWKFALYRVVFGLIMVLGVSALAGRFFGEEDREGLEQISQFMDSDRSLWVDWGQALWQLIKDTIPAYLIFVTLLGAFRGWLFPLIDPHWADSILVLIGLAIAGTLFVIPTAAEIPIVQTLLSSGLGIGPAAALILTLPAINLPSLLIVRRAFSWRVLLFVAVGVMIVGVLGGLTAAIIL